MGKCVYTMHVHWVYIKGSVQYTPRYIKYTWLSLDDIHIDRGAGCTIVKVFTLLPLMMSLSTIVSPLTVYYENIDMRWPGLYLRCAEQPRVAHIPWLLL